VTNWNIAWTPTGSRSLARSPEKVAAAVLEFVYGPLLGSPWRCGKPLRFEMEGLQVARRGDYRVIYEIDEGARRIIIHLVDHRAIVYRRR